MPAGTISDTRPSDVKRDIEGVASHGIQHIQRSV